MLVATPVKTLALLALVSAAAHAVVVTYNWNITYVNTNPDGFMNRRVMGINGQFPPPATNVTLNDTLAINVVNQISEPTTLHAHGANFTYTIFIEQYGTYWIHGHNKGHYVDGLRAPLIIHNPAETYHYDEEYTLAFVDWYHEDHSVLLDDYLSIFNPTGAEPAPKSALINQMPNTQFSFVPGKIYRLCIINMSTLAMFHIHIDGHDMNIIVIDGVDVQRTTVKTFPISAAQRYSVLVTTKNITANNFLIHGDMDPEMFDTVPDTLQMNLTGTIIYDAASPLAPAQMID
ncbi:ferroxidase fet3 [Linnemannia schmuckeri]|uniref:Ferroxidase fet3 n=1 Tax=Linnemannia schmuckeri TaxID=64567 RepID=A0A9P5S1D3_9FUNG|nr:ferroxidase fet3 [Linnemannia schmuckeri]